MRPPSVTAELEMDRETAPARLLGVEDGLAPTSPQAAKALRGAQPESAQLDEGTGERPGAGSRLALAAEADAGLLHRRDVDLPGVEASRLAHVGWA